MHNPINRSLGKKSNFLVLFSSLALAWSILGTSCILCRISQHHSLGASCTHIWVYEEAARRPAVFMVGLFEKHGLFEEPKSLLCCGVLRLPLLQYSPLMLRPLLLPVSIWEGVVAVGL